MDDNIMTLTEDERRKNVKKLLDLNPDSVPVIFRLSRENAFAKKITKTRMLLPRNMKMIDLAKHLRKNFDLTAETGLSFSTNERILPASMSMGEAYLKYQSDDLLLYLKIHEISPFGTGKW